MATALGLSAAARAQPADATGAGALPAQLSLDQAVQLFRQRGFDLLLAETSVASAEGDVAIAGAVPNPSASAGVGWTFYKGGCQDATGAAVQCPPPSWSVGLSDSNALEDAVSGKRGLRLDVARAALEAARHGRDDARRVLESSLKQQFVQTLIAGEALKLAVEVAQTSNRTLELTQTRYQAGAVSEADVARVETAKLEADQAVDAARQNLEQARYALAYLLGARGKIGPFEVVGPQLMRSRPDDRLSSAGPDPLLAEALEHRPDLLSARRQRERALSQLALSRRLRFPDIGLSASYGAPQLSPSAAFPGTLSVGLSASLPLFYQQQGEIQRAEADLRAQEISVAKAESQVAADVQSAFSGYLTADKLVRRMEGGLLERARRARELVLIQFQKGAASLLDALDAQRTFASTNLEYLQDVTAYWTSLFKLEQAVGRDLP